MRTVLEEVLELVPNYSAEVLSVLGRVCLLASDILKLLKVIEYSTQ